VAWYDNRRGLTNANGTFRLDVFATYSTDGGLTFKTAWGASQGGTAINAIAPAQAGTAAMIGIFRTSIPGASVAGVTSATEAPQGATRPSIESSRVLPIAEPISILTPAIAAPCLLSQ